MITNYGLFPKDTLDGLPMPINSKEAIGPEKFVEICKGIVMQHEGHEAHRMLDQAVTNLLSSLGYGEGMAIFTEAVSPYHIVCDREDVLMNTLIKRLEALTAPCREIDSDIGAWITNLSRKPNQPRCIAIANCAPYTASIDASMTLVPKGWTVAHITQNDDKSWFVELREGFLTSYKRVAMSPTKTATPAIALCIASLRAREATNA